MNFQEAFALMQEGEYVSRHGWDAEGPNSGFSCIMPTMLNIWRNLVKPTPNAGIFIPTIADLLADDWYKVDRSHNPKVIIDPVIEEVASA